MLSGRARRFTSLIKSIFPSPSKQVNHLSAGRSHIHKNHLSSLYHTSKFVDKTRFHGALHSAGVVCNVMLSGFFVRWREAYDSGLRAWDRFCFICGCRLDFWKIGD